MKTPSGALAVAQRGAVVEPRVRVRVADVQGAQRRLRWNRWYTGPEADLKHAACVTGDGTVLRFFSVASGLNLQFQRITSPGPGSSWGTWSDFTAATAGADVACAASGSRVVVLYLNGSELVMRHNANHGAPGFWSAELTFGSGWNTTNHWAVAMRDASTALLVAEYDGTIYSRRWTAASGLSSIITWSSTAPGCKGLAAAYVDGDFWVVVTSVGAGGAAKLEQQGFGDGGTLATDVQGNRILLEETSDGSAVRFERPSLVVGDVVRLAWVERYTGTGAYSRVYTALQPAGTAMASAVWSEGVPFGSELTNGVWLLPTSTGLLASAPSGVWQGPYGPLNGVDVSGRVVAVSYQQGPRSGRCRVELDNSDGVVTPGSGAYGAVALGSEIRIEAGLRLPGGAIEYGQAHCFRVAAIGWDASPGRARVVLEGENAWELLARWTPVRPLVFSGRSVSQIVDRILGRLGFVKGTLTASTSWTGLEPAFVVLPGESGAAAIARVLRLVEDELFLREREFRSIRPQAGDSAVVELGLVHQLRSYRRAERAPVVNLVEVVGDGVRGLALDVGSAELVGARRLYVRDQRLTTATVAGNRATAELRGADYGEAGDEAELAPFVGVELWDVLAISEARAGLSGAKRRVLGHSLEWRTDRPGGVWSQKLELGMP